MVDCLTETLSAINSQVARYAHAQKQRKTVVKSHSAPSSPPSLGSEANCQQKEDATITQDDQLHKRNRRASQPTSSRNKRGSVDQLTRIQAPFLSRRKSSDKSNATKETVIIDPVDESLDAKDKQANNDPPPEDLADLFQNLCRITKYPSYQAFPFFLNLEERRLAHYCKWHS